MGVYGHLWSCLVAYEVTSDHLLSNDFLIGCYPGYLSDGISYITAYSGRDDWSGLPAHKFLRDSWSMGMIKKSGAEWFIPFIQRMADGEKLAVWELARGYELNHGEPMVVEPPHMTAWLTTEILCCRPFRYKSEAPHSPSLSFPVPPSIRDTGWRPIVACRWRGNNNSEGYRIALYPKFFRGEPSIWIEWLGRGGIFTPAQVLKDTALLDIISQTGAEWFIPVIHDMSQGRSFNIWEIRREYENHRFEPMHVLPPGIFFDQYYCGHFFGPGKTKI